MGRPRTPANGVMAVLTRGACCESGWALEPERSTSGGRLTAAHGEPAVLDALRWAVAFRRWRAGDVASILAAGNGVPTPRPLGTPSSRTCPSHPPDPWTPTSMRRPAPDRLITAKTQRCTKEEFLRTLTVSRGC